MRGSPCRAGDGPRRHRCSRWHAELVHGYRAARAAAEAAAEAATLGYATELAHYRQSQPAVTFRDYLLGVTAR